MKGYYLPLCTGGFKIAVRTGSLCGFRERARRLRTTC